MQQTRQVDNQEKCFVLLLFLGICMHSRHSSSSCLSEWLCTCVNTCRMIEHFVLCECVYTVPSLLEKEGESSRVNLALLSFPQPFYVCNYIPPLIENRALPQSSCNKELLFSFCVYWQVYVATTTSYPWVFPLMLSSRLISYRKLITDWLCSCFPLISHGPAWGSVLRGWLRWAKNNKHVVLHVYTRGLHTVRLQMQMSGCGNLYKQWNCLCLCVWWKYV